MFGTGVATALAFGSNLVSAFVTVGIICSTGAMGFGIKGGAFVGIALRVAGSWGKRERTGDGSFNRTILVGFDGLLLRVVDVGIETFDKELDARRGGFADFEGPAMI